MALRKTLSYVSLGVSVLALGITIGIFIEVRANLEESQNKVWFESCTRAHNSDSGDWIPPFRELCRQRFGLELPPDDPSIHKDLIGIDWDTEENLHPDLRKAWENRDK